jgi:hypothetical protein
MTYLSALTRAFRRRIESDADYLMRRCQECKHLALSAPEMTPREVREHERMIAAQRMRDEAKRVK